VAEATGNRRGVRTVQGDAHEEATVYFDIDKVVAIEDAQLGH
jgi:hypothetical protein